jgi:hypothetical protein
LCRAAAATAGEWWGWGREEQESHKSSASLRSHLLLFPASTGCCRPCRRAEGRP